MAFNQSPGHQCLGCGTVRKPCRHSYELRQLIPKPALLLYHKVCCKFAATTSRCWFLSSWILTASAGWLAHRALRMTSWHVSDGVSGKSTGIGWLSLSVVKIAAVVSTMPGWCSDTVARLSCTSGNAATVAAAFHTRQHTLCEATGPVLQLHHSLLFWTCGCYSVPVPAHAATRLHPCIDPCCLV